MAVQFRSLDVDRIESEITKVHQLVSVDLTEPYTIAIYIYFLKSWPELAIFAYADKDPDKVIGCIVGSLKDHHGKLARGYIAMLAVRHEWRGMGYAKQLIAHQTAVFQRMGADEIVLEAETSNEAAVHLYESQGFIRTRKMHHYYFVMQDAYRLVLPLTEKALKPLPFLEDLNDEEMARLAEPI